MDVREIMTPDPKTVARTASLDEVMQVMDRNTIRHLPVVDGSRVVGVLSDRDLLQTTGWRPEFKRESEGEPTLESLMTKNPVCCSPDDSVVMIAVDLTSRMIGCLPVVEHGKLVGIVTEMDLLTAYLDLSGKEGSSANLNDPVSAHMATDLVAVPPESTLGQSLEQMKAKAVRHLLVEQDHQLLGVLSDRDLRKALGRGQSLETPVSEIMSVEPLTVDSHAPLTRAASFLLEGRIGALPVIKDKEPVGILSLTDLLDHCIVNLRRPDRS